MNAIFKFVMSMLAKKSGKTGITTIPKASGLNVELTAKQIQKTLENMGVDISKIKSPKEVQKYLNIHGSWMDQQLKQKAKALGLTDPKKNIFMQKKDTIRSITNRLEESTKKIEDILMEEKQFKGWKPTIVPKEMPVDDYGKLKEEWFSRIIANTDEDLNTFLKRGIDKADDRFKNLSKDQRKDFLNMVEDRIQLGNEKFMDVYTDTEGIFNKFPEDLASGGVAGGGRASSGLNYLLGEDDQNVRVPVNQGGRIGFGLGGFNAARRAFLKILGAGAAGVGAAKSGLFGLLKGTGKKQVVERFNSSSN